MTVFALTVDIYNFLCLTTTFEETPFFVCNAQFMLLSNATILFMVVDSLIHYITSTR